jgi:hypothetical protein
VVLWQMPFSGVRGFGLDPLWWFFRESDTAGEFGNESD